MLHKMLNCILSTGYVPKWWSSTVIHPILKKGDVNDPNNYRAIGLGSNLGKLFINILNNRLLSWSSANDVTSDAQFGFQPRLLIPCF